MNLGKSKQIMQGWADIFSTVYIGQQFSWVTDNSFKKKQQQQKKPLAKEKSGGNKLIWNT